MNGSIAYDEHDMNPVKVQETALAMRIMEKLIKEFPGYDWHVEVSFQAEIATVRTEFGGQWGYVLHLDQVIHDPSLKLVRWAGGELLERYNLSRDRADQSAIDSLAVDLRGVATPQM